MTISVSQAVSLGVVLGLLPFVVLVGRWLFRRAGVYLRQREARTEAVHLLRTERPNHDERWSWQDWEWAYRRVSTPEALGYAEFCRKLAEPPPRPRLRSVR